MNVVVRTDSDLSRRNRGGRHGTSRFRSKNLPKCSSHGTAVCCSKSPSLPEDHEHSATDKNAEDRTQCLVRPHRSSGANVAELILHVCADVREHVLHGDRARGATGMAHCVANHTHNFGMQADPLGLGQPELTNRHNLGERWRCPTSGSFAGQYANGALFPQQSVPQRPNQSKCHFTHGNSAHVTQFRGWVKCRYDSFGTGERTRESPKHLDGACRTHVLHLLHRVRRQRSSERHNSSKFCLGDRVPGLSRQQAMHVTVDKQAKKLKLNVGARHILGCASVQLLRLHVTSISI